MDAPLAGYLSGDAKSLVKALLEKDAGRRLGSGATGAAAVKAHPFFRRINWQALTARQVCSQPAVAVLCEHPRSETQ